MSEADQKKTPRWRRWLRRMVLVLSVLLLVLLLLVGGLLYSLRLEGVQARVLPLVLEQLKPLLPGLSLGSLRGTVTEGVVLERVVLKDRFGGDAIALERLELRYDLWALLRREVRVKEVRIKGPRVWLRKTRTGALNLAELITPGPKEPEESSGPLTLRVVVEQLNLEGGRLDLERQMGGPLKVAGMRLDLGARMVLRGGGFTAAVERLVLRIPGVTLPDGKQLSLSLSGDAGLSEERVHADLKLGAEGLKPARAATLVLKAAGTMARPFAELKLKLPGGGNLLVKAKAELPSWKLAKYSAELSLSKLNPEALWPGLPHGALGLEAKAAGEGIPLKPGSTAKVKVTSAGAKVLQYALKRLKLEASLGGDRWKLGSLEALAYGAKLTARGSGDLKQVTSAKVRLDLPSLNGLPLPAGLPSLAGAVTLAATASGPFSGPFAGTAKVSGAGLAVDRVKLGELGLEVKAAGLPANPSGKLDLTLSALDPGSPDLRLDSATLKASGGSADLKLDLTAAGPKIGADLGARLSLAGEQLSISLERLALAFKGQGLELKNRPGVQVKLKKALDLGPSRFELLGGKVELEGKVKLRGQPRLTASVQARGLRPLKGKPRVDVDLAAEVGSKALVATLSLDAGAKVDLQARMPVRYKKGPVPGIDLGGPLSLTLAAPALDLAVLNKWLPDLPPLKGAAKLKLEASGTLRAPRGRLALSLKGGGLGGLKDIAGDLDLKLMPSRTVMAARFKQQGEALLALDLTAGIGLGRLVAARKRLMATLEQTALQGILAFTPSSLALAGKLMPELEDRLEGAADVRLTLDGMVLRPVAGLKLSSRKVKLDGSRLPDLEGEGTAIVGGDKMQASVKLAAAGKPILAATARLEASLRRLVQGKRALGEALFDAEAEVPETSLRRLGGSHPQLGRLRGKLTASAVAKGLLGQLPQARVEVKLKGGGLGRVKLGDLKLLATLAAGGKLGVDLALRQKGKKVLEGAGSLELKRPNRPDALDLKIKGKELDLAFLAGLSPSLRESAGKLALDLKLTGKLKRPQLSGELNLDQGRLQLSSMAPLQNMKLNLAVTPRQLAIKNIVWSSGGGTILGSGVVQLEELRPTTFKLDARASKYDLGVAPVQGSALTTTIHVKGELKGNKLMADVVLDESQLKLAKIGGGRKLHRAGELPEVLFVDDPRVLRRLRGEESKEGGAATPLALQVTATVDPLLVRGEELDVEASADVQARSDEQGRVRLYGEAKLRRGWFMVLDNKYLVKRATVQFGGEATPNPALDVLLSHEFSDVTVYVAVAGTARKPELNLSSEPAIYSRAQILAMILTGKTEILQSDDQEADPASAVTAAVVQTVLGPITRKVASTVGLDVAKVSLEEQKNKSEEGDEAVSLKAQAEVGKYLTDRVYIGYRKVFGADDDENSHEGILEYSISSRWLLMALFGDKGVGGVDLFWTYRY